MRGTTSLLNPPRILLRNEGRTLRGLARGRNWITFRQIADGLGSSLANVSRVLSERQPPGEIFIAATLAAFPDAKFEDLFEVVTEREARQRLRTAA